MTLIITVYVKEGIVMASDSRSTYQNEEIMPDNNGGEIRKIRYGVHITDTVYKTFVTKNHIGISTCGDSSINGSPITGYIESFIRENSKTSIVDMPNKLIKYFKNLDENLDTIFHIAGYKSVCGETIQKIYIVDIFNEKIEEIMTNNQGATWSGEPDVLTRILNDVSEVNANESKQLPLYPVLWQYFTLQDAVEFAEYAIKTTIDTMRFQQRVKTVGGPIDILVIKPDKHIWLAKKGLHTSFKSLESHSCEN